MNKFKKGDRCVVVKNALSPRSVGHVVEIVDVIGKYGYKIRCEGLTGYAAESCLVRANEAK